MLSLVPSEKHLLITLSTLNPPTSVILIFCLSTLCVSFGEISVCILFIRWLSVSLLECKLHESKAVPVPALL